eukprot:3457864-Rhodomonas_salina.1
MHTFTKTPTKAIYIGQFLTRSLIRRSESPDSDGWRESQRATSDAAPDSAKDDLGLSCFVAACTEVDLDARRSEDHKAES